MTGSRKPIVNVFVLPAIVALALTACGDDTAATTTAAAAESTTTEAGMAHMDEAFDWGGPAGAASATVVIDVTAADSMSFDPETVTVHVGDIVTFRVTNSGVIPHDFTVGDAATQDEHDEEMANMAAGDHMDDPNAITLEPGETKELTLEFTKAGTLLFGCHVPGHYAAGMVGTLEVTG